MSTGIPLYLLGRNLAVSITPQDVDAYGNYTNNAIGTLNLRAVIDDDSFESTLITQNLPNVNSWNENPVPVGYRGVYTITEIMTALPKVSNAAQVFGYGNYLEAAVEASWYHKVVVSLMNNAGATQSSWTFIALMSNLRRTGPKGKNTMVATLELVAVGNGSGGFILNPQIS